MSMNCNIQSCLKYLAKILMYVFFIFGMLLLIIDVICFFEVEKVPQSNSVICSSISDDRLSGNLELFYERYSGYYWLKYNESNKSTSKLVWRSGTINATIAVNIIGYNKIQIILDWIDDRWHKSMQNEIITLDLSKKQTKNVSLTRRLMQWWY